MACLQLFFAELLEHLLGEWCSDSSLWPAQLDYAAFCQWIEVSLHSMVFDMVEAGQPKHGLNSRQGRARDVFLSSLGAGFKK
jgi:hypothetical protein